jgi:hypothetical protein
VIFGQAIMWLLAGKFSFQSRRVNCLVSLVVMAAAGAGAMVSSLGFEFSSYGFVAGIALAILLMAIGAGQGIAGFMCRRKYSVVKFSLLTALWEVVIVVILMASYGIFAIIAMWHMGVLQAGVILFGIITSSAVMGVIVYVMNLPFLILVQKNQFWRQRFLKWAQVAQPQIVVLPPAAENQPLS